MHVCVCTGRGPYEHWPSLILTCLSTTSGEDDYVVCKAHGIPLRSFVDDGGKFTDDLPQFAGTSERDWEDSGWLSQ